MSTIKQRESNTTASAIIKEAMKERGVTQAAFAKTMGYSTQSGVSSRLIGNITFGTAFKMLDILGYDIAIIDRETGERKWTVKEIQVPSLGD